MSLKSLLLILLITQFSHEVLAKRIAHLDDHPFEQLRQLFNDGNKVDAEAIKDGIYLGQCGYSPFPYETEPVLLYIEHRQPAEHGFVKKYAPYQTSLRFWVTSRDYYTDDGRRSYLIADRYMSRYLNRYAPIGSLELEHEHRMVTLDPIARSNLVALRQSGDYLVTVNMRYNRDVDHLVPTEAYHTLEPLHVSRAVTTHYCYFYRYIKSTNELH